MVSRGSGRKEGVVGAQMIFRAGNLLSGIR